MIDFENSQLSSKYRAPMIKTPFTDLFMHIGNLQNRKDCARYEIMFLDCMETYGHHIGKKKCRLILEDMYECIYRVKRLRRFFAMHNERARQYTAGERKEHYNRPGPPLDVY